TILTWDPPVMRALARRGAGVPDFLALLDQYLPRIPRAPEAEVRMVYRKTRLYYFDQVRDPAREAPFLMRLGGGRAEAAPGRARGGPRFAGPRGRSHP